MKRVRCEKFSENFVGENIKQEYVEEYSRRDQYEPGKVSSLIPRMKTKKARRKEKMQRRIYLLFTGKLCNAVLSITGKLYNYTVLSSLVNSANFHVSIGKTNSSILIGKLSIFIFPLENSTSLQQVNFEALYFGIPFLFSLVNSMTLSLSCNCKLGMP